MSSNLSKLILKNSPISMKKSLREVIKKETIDTFTEKCRQDVMLPISLLPDNSTIPKWRSFNVSNITFYLPYCRLTNIYLNN